MTADLSPLQRQRVNDRLARVVNQWHGTGSRDFLALCQEMNAEAARSFAALRPRSDS